MKPDKQFEHLLKAVKKYSTDVGTPEKNFVTGTILGYTFRLFQDSNEAYLCINDPTSEENIWPAFYDESELDEWVINNKL